MKRSSADNPPRVGMVVRLARYSNGSIVGTDEGPIRTIAISNEVRGAVTGDGYAISDSLWSRGQYDIISEPAECVCTTEHYDTNCPVHPCTEDECKRGHGGKPCPVAYPPPCNCAQSLALIDALRRIVSAIGDDMLLHKRAPIDVLTEVNLIAREALK